MFTIEKLSIQKIYISQKKENRMYILYHLVNTVTFLAYYLWWIINKYVYIPNIKYKMNQTELFYLCFYTAFYVMKYTFNILCLKHISLY